ncbi:MAG: ribonuclease [Devosia nanyangense]|uniref:Ribonuclease n=1 Tax=Devosia nanyangense TaxID=1228055 RepID=A0A933KZG3_9HYPH|nr:ribonuclease [Devosia nanyangense]
MARRLAAVDLLAAAIAAAVALWIAYASQTAPKPAAAAPPSTAQSTRAAFYVLAVTWLPAFCELKPRVRECHGTPTPRFALHGLWPGGEYCGIDGDMLATDQLDHWNDLPALRLTDATWAALRAAMPGTKSRLERHEWVVHGSCSGASPDTYFAGAAALLGELDRSPVHDLFVANAGRDLTRTEVAAAFDGAFGKGAGRRVRLSCEDDGGGRQIIDELTIALYGDPFGGDTLAALLAAAHPRGGGCAAGNIVE